MAIQACQVGRRAVDGSWLIESVDVRIEDGERIAVVGASGSGKTLLLRALAMLDPIDSGSVRWRDAEIDGHHVPEYRGQVIYLHQSPALAEGSVEENLAWPFQWKTHSAKKFQRNRIMQWLSSLGRDASFLAKRSRDLSGGEAQIVALLRAIQLDPAMLLLDEPTAALDQTASAAVESLVDQWFAEQPQQRSFLWVSHDRAQAERVAERILTIEKGRLKEST